MGATTAQHRTSTGAYSSRMASRTWLQSPSGTPRWKTSLKKSNKVDVGWKKILRCFKMLISLTPLILMTILVIIQQPHYSLGQMVHEETLSGEETDHLTSTCQYVFSNTTYGFLYLQSSVIGEFLSIMMVNLFNAPLKLSIEMGTRDTMSDGRKILRY